MTPGTTVGDYVLEDSLGRGAVAEVYRARHRVTGALYAIKFLNLSLAEHAAIARFRREGEVQATADAHPNVLRVHALGQTASHLYLVQDLAHGGSLDAVLARGAEVPWEQALDWTLQLAQGLQHVHRLGILHRDLKPANVLLSDTGVPRLADFGLARGTSGERLTETGALLGSPAYMAPEQVDGSGVDERTDVYGMGALLYHVLTGRPPFAGALITIVKAVLGEAPTPIRSLRRVPPALERVCQRAMHKDPAQRYRTAGELAEALAAARTPSPRVSGGSLVLVGAIVGCLALSGVGAWALSMHMPTTVANAPATEPPALGERVFAAQAQFLRVGERHAFSLEWTEVRGDGVRAEVRGELHVVVVGSEQGRRMLSLRLPLSQVLTPYGESTSPFIVGDAIAVEALASAEGLSFEAEVKEDTGMVGAVMGVEALRTALLSKVDPALLLAYNDNLGTTPVTVAQTVLQADTLQRVLDLVLMSMAWDNVSDEHVFYDEGDAQILPVLTLGPYTPEGPRELGPISAKLKGRAVWRAKRLERVHLEQHLVREGSAHDSGTCELRIERLNPER